MSFRFRCAATALLAALTACTAAAEDLAALPLDVLLDMEVGSASRIRQRMSESAASVSVITSDEIRAMGWRTLGQALRSLRGVVVSSDRIYDYIGVRGFFSAGDYNTRVLLLIDGNRVNDAVYDQAYIGDEFPLDLALVERIEFVPGPGSAVFGANALFGVVNVITRASGALPHGSAGVRLGSGGRRAVAAQARGEAGGGTLLVAASRQLADGYDVEDPAQGIARGVDYERRNAVYLRYNLGPVAASVVHGDRLKGVPLYPGLIFGDPRTRYRDVQTLTNIEWRHAVGKRSELTARLFAGDYRFVGDFAVDSAPATINRDVSRGRWWGVEARVFSAELDRHKLVAGGEWQRAGVFQGNHDADGSATYLHDNRHDWRAALFAEDQWQLTRNFAATLGLRADRAAGHIEASPRVALNWRPAEPLVLKAIHGRAFRPPNAYEAHYQMDGPGGYRHNPAIRLERVQGNELALEWLPADHVRLAASLFRNYARDLIVLDYDAIADRYEFRNGGSLTSHGLELELERAWRDGARLRANLTLQRARSDGALVPAEQFPRRVGKLTAVWPLPARWTLGLELQAMSRRGAASPGHAVAHAALSRPALFRGLSFTLGVRNLFDRALVDPGFDTLRQPRVPLPGREWHLGLDWAF